MTLAVIGAGYGRTGTHSMKLALEMLGLGPCHHMASVMADPAQRDLWRAAGRGQLPDWDEAFAGFGSAVDWPSAHFWRETMAHFPKAKVLLTLRSAESWYHSFSETILHTLGPDNDPASFGVTVIRNVIFGGRPNDRAHAIETFNRHNDLVRATAPADRLICHAVGDGWGPLCAGLGLAIPDAPYPNSNSGAEFRANVLKQ